MTKCVKQAKRDLNPYPSDSESDAISIKLQARYPLSFAWAPYLLFGPLTFNLGLLPSAWASYLQLGPSTFCLGSLLNLKA